MNSLRQVDSWIPKSVDDVKAAYGFPSDAVFRGYLVYLPDTEEFLISVQKFPRNWNKAAGVARLWTKYPHAAKIFRDHRQAFRVASEYDRAAIQVVHLFETADQLLVAFDG